MKTPKQKIGDVIEAVAREHQVHVRDILGRKRVSYISAARKAAIRRVKEDFPALSSTQLAEIFQRNHTTILYALGRTAHYKRRRGVA